MLLCYNGVLLNIKLHTAFFVNRFMKKAAETAGLLPSEQPGRTKMPGL